MTELTKRDIIDAVSEGLRAGGFEARVEEISRTVFHHEIRPALMEKLERVGIDCSEPETREAVRKDMEHLRKMRERAESKDGIEEAATLSSLASVTSQGVTQAVRLLLVCLILGAIAITGVGASQQGWLKAFLSSPPSGH